jgi:Sigma-70 factor, region 1.1
MASDDGERQDVFRSIVVRARSQGYLIRSETIAMLPVELFTQESQEGILSALSDMGIPIVDAAPTTAELVAMQAPRVSGSPEVFVSPSPSQPIGAPIVVLHVGAEGGEIKLIGQELTTAWRYRCTMLDQTALWLEEGGSEIRRQSTWVYEWNDALAALDKYPWAELHRSRLIRSLPIGS